MGPSQPSQVIEGIKLVGLNVCNYMERNEQLAAKQKALGTVYCVPEVFLWTS